MSALYPQAVAAERQKAAVMNQQVVIQETQTEMLQAQIAGNETLAGTLKQELAIRQAVLKIMQSQTMTQAEMVGLEQAETLALSRLSKGPGMLAGLMGGGSPARARAEMLTLFREMASGAGTTRTLGALMGTLGTVFTSVGLAGYGLYKAITMVGDTEEASAKKIVDANEKLNEHEKAWMDAARAVDSFADAQKLAMQTLPTVTSTAKEAADAWKAFGQGPGVVKSFMEFLAMLGGAGDKARPFQDALEKTAKGLDEVAQRARTTGLAMMQMAQSTAFEILEAKTMPVADAIQMIQTRIREITEQRAQLQPLVKAEDYELFVRYTNQLSIYGNVLQGLFSKQEKQRELIESTTRAIALNNAAGDEEQTIQVKNANAYAAKLKELEKAGIATADATKLAREFADSEEFAARATKEHGDALDDLSGDLKVLIEYWEEYTKIQQYSTDDTSRHFHQLELLEKTIKGLGDPIRDVEKLMPGLSPDERALARWMAWQEQAERSLKEVEMRARAGIASMGDIWHAGLYKMANDMGTWQTNAITLIGRVGDILASNLTSGLADILDGTKSVSDGFREMALNIVKSLERAILELLVIKPLINAISTSLYGGGGGTTAAVAGLGSAFGGGQQRGGRIGGTGNGDHVPVLAEPGEYVIRRDAAQRIGYDQLERMNKMRGGGRVGANGWLRMQRGGGVGTYYWPGGGGIEGRNEFSTGTTYTGGRNPQYFSLENPNAPWVALALGPNSPYHYGQYVMLSNGRIGRFVDYGPGVRHFDVVSRTYYRGGPPIRIAGGAAGRAAIPGGFGGRRGPVGFGGGIRAAGGMPFWQRAAYESGYGGAWRTAFGGGPPSLMVGPPPGRVLVGPEVAAFWAGEGAKMNVPTREGGGFGPTDVYGRPAFPAETGASLIENIYGAPGINITSPTGTAIWRGGSAFVSGSTPGGGFGGFNIPGGIPFAPGSPGGSLGGFGGILGAQIRQHALRYGMTYTPTAAIRGFAAAQGYRGALGWTPELIHAWRRRGLPGIMRGRERGTAGERFGIMGGRAPTKTFHGGGIVDSWSEFQSGGTVQRGEGVFTPAQMSRLAPAGPTINSSQVNVTVNNLGGGRASTSVTTTGGPGGLNEKDARDIGRMVSSLVDARIEKQRRSGGSLYSPRAG
jgi:hypothetical protein